MYKVFNLKLISKKEFYARNLGIRFICELLIRNSDILLFIIMMVND
jgi:hypothetical protein